MERIKQLRKRQGLSLAALAAHAKMLPQQIAYAERAGTDPRASTIARIAAALDVPVCVLFDKEGKHETHKKHRRPRR